MTRGTIQKFAKLGQMGRQPGLRDLLLNFGTSSISKERLKIQTSKFKFGVCIGHEEAYPKITKLSQLGTGSGSRDLLLNFGTPSISTKRLKICLLYTSDAADE